MEKPRNGTCEQCRFCAKDEIAPDDMGAYDAQCHWPAVTEPIIDHGNCWCSHFEPPEGRVCGTCEWWRDVYCDIQVPEKRARMQHDTCAAWRWKGGVVHTNTAEHNSYGPLDERIRPLPQE